MIGVVATGVAWCAVTNTDPLPATMKLVDKVTALSDPAPTRSFRVGDQAAAAAVFGDTVVVRVPGLIEARTVGTGARRWQRPADWSAAAGDGVGAVVLFGKGHRGATAVDPGTGQVRWTADGAVGVWPYQTAVVTLTCAGTDTRQCELVGRAPADGARRWALPVTARVDAADLAAGGVNSRDRRALTMRDPRADFAATGALRTSPTPRSVGLMSGRRVETFDPAAGRRLGTVALPSGARATMIGGRVVTTTGRSARGGCASTIAGIDPATGLAAWSTTAYDPHTTSGFGCDQRRAPIGGGGVLSATRTRDGRPVMLSVSDGHEVWVGEAGDAVEALDDHVALVRTAGKTSITAIDTVTGSARWSTRSPGRVALGLCSSAALVLDQEIGQLVAMAPQTGRPLLTARLSASVLGCDRRGLVLARGRTVGVLGFSTQP